MKITFYGVRGSVAVSGDGFRRFGGNTTCVHVERGGHHLILDAGTGLVGLGRALLGRASPLRATLLFSHLHWDHIQGFPFFGPAYLPSTGLELIGPVDAETGLSLEAALRRQMSPPSFPVTLDAMASAKTFRTIGDGAELEVGPFTVTARALCHPQGSLGYRVEAGGRVFTFATDTEHPADGVVDEALLGLARGADLLAYDAQYTEDEYLGRGGPSRRGWGHSTYSAGALVARASGASRLALIHHDPSRSDDGVEGIEREARALFPATLAAREGLEVEL